MKLQLLKDNGEVVIWRTLVVQYNISVKGHSDCSIEISYYKEAREDNFGYNNGPDEVQWGV
jgi:hypothetical protein